MRTTAIFRNGMAELELFAENEWEQRLLGAVAGTDAITATVQYKHEGHVTNQRISAVSVLLSKAERKGEG